jgi:hypothetical protein
MLAPLLPPCLPAGPPACRRHAANDPVVGAELHAPAALPARPAEALFVRGDPPGPRARGHRPITRRPVITTRRDGNPAAVGRRRTRRSYDLPAGAAFAGPRRAAQDPGKAPGTAATGQAFALKWITPQERQPLLHARPRRGLMCRQLGKRAEINRRGTARAAGEVAHADR